jgi:hypothetical protein
MTATSQNGWSANDRSVIASYTIPRTQQMIALRKGDVSVILLDLLGWIHLNIEPLDVGVLDDWGYAERLVRGSTTDLSNHASGTAVDVNAVRHPLAVHGTWSADQKRSIDARLRLYEGCIRWGEEYSGRIDPMHFEVNRGAADCKRIADKIRAGQLGPTPSPTPRPPEEDDLTPDQANQLALLVSQLVVGPDPAAKAWGWPTFGGGTNETLTVVDYLRRTNQQLQNLAAQVSALETGKTAIAGPAQLTSGDLDAIAERVVKLLGAKTSA